LSCLVYWQPPSRSHQPRVSQLAYFISPLMSKHQRFESVKLLADIIPSLMHGSKNLVSFTKERSMLLQLIFLQRYGTKEASLDHALEVKCFCWEHNLI